ncbi:MAG: hypothetical protein AB8C46_05045 [Burkholderiaceae bacterium]
MLIIAIAWMYVVVLMAATQPTLLAAMLTLFGYGLFPLAIVLYLVATPARRKRAMAKQAAEDAERTEKAGNQRTGRQSASGDPDGADQAPPR